MAKPMSYQEIADKINAEEGCHLDKKEIWRIEQSALRKMHAEFARQGLTLEAILALNPGAGNFLQGQVPQPKIQDENIFESERFDFDEPVVFTSFCDEIDLGESEWIAA